MSFRLLPLGIILLFFSITLQAQKAESGALKEVDHQGYFPQVQLEDEDNLYTVDYYGGEIFVETYNKRQLRSTQSRVIELPEFRRTREKANRIGRVGDMIVLFMDLDDYRNDSFKLAAFIIDPRLGRIVESKNLMSIEYDRSREKGFYNVSFSRDHQSFVVNTATYFDDRDMTDQAIVLYDADLKEVVRRDYTMAGSNLGINAYTYMDNEGTVYFLQKNDLVMLDSYNDFEEYRETLPSEDLAINGSLINVTMGINKKQNLVITGYYQTEDTEDQDDANKPRGDRKEGDKQIEGIKCYVFNPLNQEFISQKLNLFDQKFIDEFRDEDDRKDGYVGEINGNFGHNRLHFTKDGKTYLIGQQRSYRYIYDGDGNIVGYHHYYEDILVTAFDESSELLWQERIPLYQNYYWANGFLGIWTSTSAGTIWFGGAYGTQDYFSFESQIVDDQLILVYNDVPENRASKSAKRDPERFRKLKNSKPVIQKINLANGQRKGSVESRLNQPKMYIKPGLMYYSKMDERYYYFLCYRKKIQLNALDL